GGVVRRHVRDKAHFENARPQTRDGENMKDDGESDMHRRLPPWAGDRGGAGRRLCRDEQSGCRTTTVNTRWRGL
ncbi:hypothetical protein BU14_0263s0008, partial [Porphyra umbilicalis]